MIIRDDHEGQREGCEAVDDYSRDSESGTGLQQDGGHATGGLPGVVQKPGERASVYGLEEEWPE